MSHQDVAFLEHPRGGSEFQPKGAPEGKPMARLFMYGACGYQACPPNKDSCPPVIHPTRST